MRGRVRPEGANVHLAGVDGAVGVNDNGEKGVLELLLHRLRLDVDSAEPAPVARVAVVPADDVLLPALAAAQIEVLDEIFVRLFLHVDSGLGALDGQPKGVGDHKGVAVDVTLHQAHDLQVAARPGVHGHLDERDGADAYVLEVVGVFGPWSSLGRGFLGVWVVVVECVTLGVDQLDVVVEL